MCVLVVFDNGQLSINSVVIVVKCGKNRLKNPLKTTVTTVTTVTTPFSKTFSNLFSL